VRRRTLRHDVSRELALEHRPHEHAVSSCPFDRGHVGDDGAVEPGRQLRREVARLVGMRQRHNFRIQLTDRVLQRGDVAIGRVGLEGRALDRDHLGDAGDRDLGSRGGCVRARAGQRDRDRLAAGELLHRRHRFPGGAIQLAAALFADDEDHAITRASSRSRRTSSFAASAADPWISCVFLLFSGT
jgi:hypothetical protein